MPRLRVRRLCTPVAIFAAVLLAVGAAGSAAAVVDVSLNVVPSDLGAPDAGGDWSLVAKTDDANGIAALRALLLGIDDGAVADGDAQDEVTFASGLGAIDPVPTSAGPRPPYLDLDAAGSELLYGQDVSDDLAVVSGVGTPATGDGPDPFGEPAWDDATTLASGTYPASVPVFSEVDANVLDDSSPPFTASTAPVSHVVRVMPEPGSLLPAALGAAALAGLAAPRRGWR